VEGKRNRRRKISKVRECFWRRKSWHWYLSTKKSKKI